MRLCAFLVYLRFTSAVNILVSRESKLHALVLFLDILLNFNRYLAGNGKGKYSVADVKTWPWVKNWEKSGFTKDEVKEFPHLLKWIDRIAERPAVQRGIGEAYANTTI